ncbi:MAG: hypothetical protein ACK57T_21695, partial [Dolichospermum sp.]
PRNPLVVAPEIPSWLPQESPRGCPRNPLVVAPEIPSWLPQESPRGCPRNPPLVALVCRTSAKI